MVAEPVSSSPISLQAKDMSVQVRFDLVDADQASVRTILHNCAIPTDGFMSSDESNFLSVVSYDRSMSSFISNNDSLD